MQTQARRWLTILGVALAPAGRVGGMVTCSRCHGRFGRSVLEWRRTAGAQRAVAHAEAPAA